MRGRGIVSLVILVLAMGGCVGPGSGRPAGPTALRVGLPLFPPSGVPWSGVGAPGQYVWSSVFDALTAIGPDGSVRGALAESFVARDARTWDFRLRHGVTFSNGEALDANAVVRTFQVLLSPDGRAEYAAHVSNYGSITSVTAADEATVEIVSSTANPLLPSAVSIVYIVPPRYFAEVGARGFASRPIGTGPYVAAEWGGDRITLTRRPGGSWRGPAGVDRVEFVALKEPAARVQALQSGQIDVAAELDPDQLQALGRQGFTVVNQPRAAIMSLSLIDVRGGPLANSDVRRALNYAVDKEAMARNLTAGLTWPAAWPPKGVHGYSPARQPYPHDPVRARQLLAAAGYGGGFALTAEIVVGAFPADADIYQAMAADLREVGVDVELRTVDFAGQWLPRFSGRAPWVGQAFGLSWNAAPLMDAIRPFSYFSCRYAGAFSCDQEAQALIDRVDAAIEPAARDAALEELLDHTREVPPAIFLVEGRELWATSSRVRGLTVAAFDLPLEDVTLRS